MAVEKETSYPEGQKVLKANELRWNGKTLRIPRLVYNKAYPEFDCGGQEIYSIDENDQIWRQAGTTDSIHRAKAFVRLQLSRDSQKGAFYKGTLIVTAKELTQVITQGNLPKSVEEYTNKGVTHLKFGPALKINSDYELESCKNQIGVWRPVQELDSEKHERHKNDNFDRRISNLAKHDEMKSKAGIL